MPDTDPRLAARLRDLLSDEMLKDLWSRAGAALVAGQQADFPDDGRQAAASVMRESLAAALLPLLSSLQEAREREIREALARETELRRRAERHAKECSELVSIDTWAIEQVQDIGRSLTGLHQRLVQAKEPLWAEDVARLLSRLASFSSPAAQEQK